MTEEFTFCPSKAARLIHVLAHDERLKIMTLLADHEWGVTSLAKETKLDQPALSRHLKKMRDFGVVEKRRDAQAVYYSCTNAAIVKLLRVAAELDKGPEDDQRSELSPDRLVR
jgi:ArsR family transcriptional regulator, virulence genes transcriptional regulator